MAGSTDAVRGYCARYHERELARLAAAEGRLEFAVTTRLLAPHLPPAGRVLDLGGAWKDWDDSGDCEVWEEAAADGLR